MKIVLSRYQWETIGKKAGWIKEASIDQEIFVNGIDRRTYRWNIDKVKEALKKFTTNVDEIAERIIRIPIPRLNNSTEFYKWFNDTIDKRIIERQIL